MHHRHLHALAEQIALDITRPTAAKNKNQKLMTPPQISPQ